MAAASARHANAHLQIICFSPDVYKGCTVILNVPFYHVLGAMAILGTIRWNSRGVVMKKFVPDVYLAAIERFRVTLLVVVPLLVVFLTQTPLVDKYDLSSVKKIICAVSPITKEREQALIKRYEL